MEYLAVGRVLKPQGVKGELKVEPWTRSPERFQDLSRVFTDISGYEELQVTGVRCHRGFVYLKAAGIASLEEAETLRGSLLWIPASWREQLPPGEYYIYDLLGIQVYCSGGEYLGELIEVLSLPGNDVFLVQKGQQELLIPALYRVIKRVDIAGSRMEVEMLPGLREAGKNAD